MSIALHIGRAIAEALPNNDRYTRLFALPSVVFSGADGEESIWSGGGESNPFGGESIPLDRDSG